MSGTASRAVGIGERAARRADDERGRDGRSPTAIALTADEQERFRRRFARWCLDHQAESPAERALIARAVQATFAAERAGAVLRMGAGPIDPDVGRFACTTAHWHRVVVDCLAELEARRRDPAVQAVA